MHVEDVQGNGVAYDDGDLSKTEVKSELVLSSKTWTKCVSSDMKKLKIQTINDLETKSEKREHFKTIISSAYTLSY